MFIKKTLTALSVVALVSGAPSMAFSADANSGGQSQVFKTGKGAAAGQPQSSGEIKAFTPLNCFKLAPSAD